MPIYEYQCKQCGTVFEEWQSGFEERELPCPECQGASARMISNTSFVLKGSGWYVTDYAGKNPSKSDGGDAGSAGDSGKSAESTSDSGSSASSDSSGGAPQSKSSGTAGDSGSASTSSAS